jgi:SlyX protein
MEERIVELEIRYTHQQRMLEELSEVVLEQGRALERLGRELETLRGRVEAGSEEEPANEPPPHY